MKNKIYNYFSLEFFRLFLIILFFLTAIVWTVQAVNYLDLVTEDGHAFSIYFAQSVMSVPKFIHKLVPFAFLTSMIITILRLEKTNELMVFWTSGLNKIRIVNIAFLISISVTIFQLLIATIISPSSLNYSRSLLKDSNINFFSSLLKEKQFNDTVKSLTVFVEKKNEDGTVENIFLRDDKTNLSSTTFAKKGYIRRTDKSDLLVLIDGGTQKETEGGQINFINFDKSEINLSQYKTKTTTWPKIQENTTLKIMKCFYVNSKNFLSKFYDSEFFLNISLFKCPYKKIDVINEINRRFGMPLYIPLLSLVSCFLLSSRIENKFYNVQKYFYFLIGFFILIFAEISVRYSGKLFVVSVLYYLIPIILSIVFYLFLLRIFKFENLRR